LESLDPLAAAVITQLRRLPGVVIKVIIWTIWSVIYLPVFLYSSIVSAMKVAALDYTVFEISSLELSIRLTSPHHQREHTKDEHEYE